MDETRMLKAASELCGRQVRVAGSFETTGVLADLLVHPTEGRILGFVLRTQTGAKRRLAASRLSIGEQLVASTEGWLDDANADSLAHGVGACGELPGAEVVTDDGQLFGRVTDVHVSVPDGEVFYAVSRSGFFKLFAETFQLPGDLPHAYSSPSKRLFLHSNKAEEVRAARVAGSAAGGLWQYDGFSEAMRTFASRYGVMIWLMLTMLLLGSMFYL
jgi:sporulation protein YlmC with PRC-barrel domain